MSIDYLYRLFRLHPPFMLVGDNARQALNAARTLDRWKDLENAGLVRIHSEDDNAPDASFYDT